MRRSPYPPPSWGAPMPRPPGRVPVGLVAALAIPALLLLGPHAEAIGAAAADLLHTGPQITLTFPEAKAQGKDGGALPRRSPARPAPPARPPAGIAFTSPAVAADYASPKLDRRVRALLQAIGRDHRITVSCIHAGHAELVRGTNRTSNHWVWRGVDISVVDGAPVSRANTAARALAGWIGRGQAGVRPSEVGSPWPLGGSPWFTDGDHQDHLHVGFAGPTRAGR